MRTRAGGAISVPRRRTPTAAVRSLARGRNCRRRLAPTRRRRGEDAGTSRAPRARSRMSHLEENLRALAARHPRLAAQLAAAAQLPSLPEPTPAGDPTLTADGVLLHSRHDPRREAARWAEAQRERLGERADATAVVLGLGLGYHLEALAAAWPGPIVVVESDRALWRTALAARDLRAVLARVTVAEEPLAEEAIDAWGVPVVLPHAPSVLRGNGLRALGESIAGRAALRGLRLRILVVSPLAGGSHPTAGHCARALADLGHTVRLLDLSPFARGMEAIPCFTPRRGARGARRAGCRRGGRLPQPPDRLPPAPRPRAQDLGHRVGGGRPGRGRRAARRRPHLHRGRRAHLQRHAGEPEPPLLDVRRRRRPARRLREPAHLRARCRRRVSARRPAHAPAAAPSPGRGGGDVHRRRRAARPRAPLPRPPRGARLARGHGPYPSARRAHLSPPHAAPARDHRGGRPRAARPAAARGDRRRRRPAPGRHRAPGRGAA